jgi:hypothetical protein
MLNLQRLQQLQHRMEHAAGDRKIPSVQKVVENITRSPVAAIHLLRQARSTTNADTINLRTLSRVIMAATYNASNVDFELDNMFESDAAAAVVQVVSTGGGGQDDQNHHQQQHHHQKHQQLLQRMSQEIETGGGRRVRRKPSEQFYRRAHDSWQVQEDRRGCNYEYGLSDEDHLDRLRAASLLPPSELPTETTKAIQAELDTFRRLHVCGMHRYNRWMMRQAIRIILTHCRRLDSITLAWSDALIVPFIRDISTIRGSSSDAFGKPQTGGGQLALRHLQVKCFGLPFNGCIWNLTRKLAVRKLTVYTCLVNRVNVDFLVDLVRGSELEKLVIVSVEPDHQKVDSTMERRPRQRFLEPSPRIYANQPQQQQQLVPPARSVPSDLRYLHAVGLYQIWPNFCPLARLDDTLRLLPRLELLYAHFFPDTIADPPDFGQLRWALDGCETRAEAHTALRLIFDSYMLPKGDIGYWQRTGRCRFSYWEPVPRQAQFQSRAVAAVIVYPRLDLTFMVTCRKTEERRWRFPMADDITRQARSVAEAMNRQARPRPGKNAIRRYPTRYTPLRPAGRPFDLAQTMRLQIPMSQVVRDLQRRVRRPAVPVTATKTRRRGADPTTPTTTTTDGDNGYEADDDLSAYLKPKTTTSASSAAASAAGSGTKRKAAELDDEDDDDDGDACPICMDSLHKRVKLELSADGDYKWSCDCGECPLPMHLPCPHKQSFHTVCLGIWFKKHNTCPVCRGLAEAARETVVTNMFQARKPTT